MTIAVMSMGEGGCTLDGANDWRGGHVPEQVHGDDLVRLPSRPLRHRHRPHAHRICSTPTNLAHTLHLSFAVSQGPIIVLQHNSPNINPV